MAYDAFFGNVWIDLHDLFGGQRQGMVLVIGERCLVCAFQFNADGKIIAVLSSFEA